MVAVYSDRPPGTQASNASAAPPTNVNVTNQSLFQYSRSAFTGGPELFGRNHPHRGGPDPN